MNLLLVEQGCSEVARTVLNKQYYFGLIVGWLSVLFSYALVNLPEILGRRKKMLSKMQSLIGRNEGIVTVTDLVVTAEVSPEKAAKFLANFARKLEVEADVEEETGARFYRFSDAKQIAKKLSQSN